MKRMDAFATRPESKRIPAKTVFNVGSGSIDVRTASYVTRLVCKRTDIGLNAIKCVNRAIISI